MLPLSPVSGVKFPVQRFESIYRPKRLLGSPYQVYSALFVYEIVDFISKKNELNAEEKVLYERLKKDYAEKNINTQILLEPMICDTTKGSPLTYFDMS